MPNWVYDVVGLGRLVCFIIHQVTLRRPTRLRFYILPILYWAYHTVLMDLSKTDHRLVNDQTFRHLPASWRHGFLGSPGPVVHQRALHRLVTERVCR